MVKDVSDDLFRYKIAPMVLERLPDAVFVVSATGEIVAVNEAAAVLTGWPEPELLHGQLEMLLPEHLREQHVRLRDGYMRDPRTRAMGAGLELELLRRDGELVPVEINLAVIAAEELYTVATVRRRGSP